MNGWIYLLSILDNLSAVGSALLFTLSTGITIVAGFGVIGYMIEEEVADRIKKLSIVIQKPIYIVVFILILLAMVPSRKSLMESYIMYEGSKVIKAENAEKAIQAFDKKIDKLIEAIGK